MRYATEAEQAAVVGFFNDWEDHLWPSIQDDRMLRMSGNKVCLVAPYMKALDLPDDVPSVTGLCIGTIDDEFIPNGQAALLIARETDRRSVRVTEHASRLFLYSRDILGDSIEIKVGPLEDGSVVLVRNPRNEGLGFGRIVGKFKGGSSAIEAVHDLGEYLR